MLQALKKKKSYLFLLFVITISCLFIYVDFIFGNSFFMFGDIGSDTKSQYVMWYSSIADKIRTGTFSFWDFKNGFGANIAIEGLYDPFQFLICIFGAICCSPSIPNILIYINILKVVLAGLFMLYFLGSFSLSEKVKVITAYMYAFNGFMMVWGQHYQFATIVVYLPLLFAAVEQALHSKKRWIFVALMTAIIGVYSLYFCYMSLITVGIYGFIRILQMDGEIKEKVKVSAREIFAVLLGLGIACFALLPSAYVILNVSMRTDSDASIVQRLISSFTFFPREYYKMLAFRTFSSNLQGSVNYFGYLNYYEALNFCCSNLLIFLLFQYMFLLFRKSVPLKEKFVRLTAVLLLAVAFLFPTAGLIYNGFAYSMHRWSFVVIPILIVMAAKTLEEIITSKKISIIAVCGYLLLSLIVYWKAFKRFEEAILSLNAVILCFTGCIIAIVVYLYIKEKINAQTLSALLLSCVCVNFVSDGYISANYRGTVKKDGTYIANVYNVDVKNAVDYLKEKNPNFFRVEKTFISEPMNMADPLAQNYYGINMYNSLVNKNVLKFNEIIWKNIQIGPFSYQLFNNAKQDHLKASLVGLKYIMTNNKDENINGFSKIKEFGNIAVLENNYDVALGRLYTKSIDEKTFEEESFNVDNLLADAVILEKNIEFEVSHADLVTYRNPQSDEQILKAFQEMPLAQFKVVGNDGNLVSDFEAPRDGLMLLTIPFEGGWHAYVDGQKSDILKADYGFSALRLAEGQHHIEMKFILPGLNEGTIISAFCFLILIALALYQKKKEAAILND